MTHKGWLAISAANRFKRRHINFQTGKVEEGTYVTAANYIVDAINMGYKKGKLKGIMQEFKDLLWIDDTMETYIDDRKNRRAGVEMNQSHK